MARPAGTKAPENETKADKFKRLASGRAQTAIAAIKGIGNLAGSAYEHTDAEVAKLENVFIAAINDMKSALNRSGGGKPSIF